jgi:alanyl-tRNA synthetase
MKSQELRQRFIDYFVKMHGHTEVPSSSVIPREDPTLLFINAGMNQFKSVFLDKEKPVSSRIVNSQKCIRVSGKHNDLEEVGKDDYHHTFFEMLGNWSFGDYYKAEAIEWAWELLIKEWQFPVERLFATVYKTDDESYNLWKKISGLPESRILRFGDKDNFWEMGSTGPCGPSSEIHCYRGPLNEKIDPLRINTGDPRYIELWNLVFIQYNRDEDGKLHPLSKKHVDTGAGFERLLSTLNGFSSNYDTDVFQDIIRKIEKISGVKYDQSSAGIPHRVIADHLRMLSFSIADGAMPANDGRGYVLRRLLRRAARYGKKIGLNDPFIHSLVPDLVHCMGDAFPELVQNASLISNVIQSEEVSFLQTLDRGLAIFEDLVLHSNKRGLNELSGDDVFKLYDTFGFPVDLTRLLAEERGLIIDEKGFEEKMAGQKERARAAGQFHAGFNSSIDWKHQENLSGEIPTEFVGYELLQCTGRLVKWAHSDDSTFLVFDKTPFYAESGGQIGDRGIITGQNKRFTVDDTRKEGDHIIHIIKTRIPENEIPVTAELTVTEARRMDTARNHTGTHLLHAALRKVLGNHVRQAGSYVGPDNLRFDFSHYQKVTAEELKKIQYLVNEQILHNITLTVHTKSFDEAVEEGATALFGEKYGENVRTIKAGDFSYELCGGTHVHATGDVGYLIILNESSVASGVRRIEAVTGYHALKQLADYQEITTALSSRFKVPANQILNKIEEITSQIRTLEKEKNELMSRLLTDSVDDYLKNPQKVGDISVYTAIVPVKTMDQLKELGDRVREKLKSGCAVFGMVSPTGPQVLCVVTDDLVKKGIHAGKIVSRIGRELGGGGGGKPHMATAGGKDSENLDAVLKKSIQFIQLSDR